MSSLNFLISNDKVPFIVVITKIDKAGADVEAVYLQLLQEEVQVCCVCMCCLLYVQLTVFVSCKNTAVMCHLWRLALRKS